MSDARNHGRRWTLLLTLLLAPPVWAVPEPSLPGQAYKRLDTFEAHELSKADKAFNGGKYKLAAKAYDAFVLEFPRSDAIAYALLRKARCLHLANSRFEALKEYQEVLDYFPNQVPFAAAALFFQGQAHLDNGDTDKALRAWTRLVEDTDYRRQPVAGVAYYHLASQLQRQRQEEKSVKYFRLAMAEYRDALDRNQRTDALRQVIVYHLRSKPDAEALAEFYREAKGFSADRTSDVAEAPLADLGFWREVVKWIGEHAKFDEFREAEKRTVYGYWAKAMGERLPDNDWFQLVRAEYQLIANGDRDQWHQRVDAIFRRGVNDQNRDERVVQWVDIYASNDLPKAKEYLGKLDLEKLNGRHAQRLIEVLVAAGRLEEAAAIYPWVKPEDLEWKQQKELMTLIFTHFRDQDMARNFFRKLEMGERDDQQKVDLAEAIRRYSEELTLECFQLMADQAEADYHRLRYFRYREDPQRGLPVAERAVKHEAHARQAWWLKAELHEHARQWEQAVQAYRQSDRLPEGLYQISECHLRLGKLEQAVADLREIENFFKGHESRAALQIAVCYRRGKKRPEEVAALRHVMKKYPRSRESSAAHERLEALGERISGAVETVD